MKRRLVLRTAVMLLILLVGSLAYLQYSWLGLLSNSEQDRMRANLQTSAQRFGEDFDLELTRLFKAFLPVDPMDPQAEATLNGIVESWRKSPHPQLLENIYLIIPQGGTLELRRWNQTQCRLEPALWEQDFSAIRKLCVDRKQQVDPQASLPVLRGFPALLIPGAKTRRELVTLDESGWTLLVLHRDFLERKLIPELTKKYFTTNGEVLYDVGIVDRSNPGALLLGSRPGLKPGDMKQPEAVANIFRLQLDNLLLEEVSVTSRDPRLPLQSDVREKQTVLLRTMPQSPSAEMKTGTTILKKEGTKTVHTFQVLTPDPVRQALFQHRAGSLEEVVSRIRRRNLLVSFSIMLLLTASILLILLEARRAHKLAIQQMNFVAGISHELRTPLSVIRSAGENLADAVVDDPEKIRRYGAVIRDEGRKLTEMIQQVLDFAGIQSGQKRERGWISVPELVAKVVGNSLQPEKGMIETEIPENLPLILGDRLALESALGNLVDNARKYSTGVRIEAHERQHGSIPEVILSVQDRGPGIDPEDLSHIFEPFYRGRNANQVHGTGLGLSVVKQVIESHGGRITVESNAGNGSCFTIYLPGKSELASTQA